MAGGVSRHHNTTNPCEDDTVRTRALAFAGVAILGGVAMTWAPPRLNPVIDLLVQKRPIFGLYAPANPRVRPGTPAADAPAPAPAKTPAQLASDALAYQNADYIFDGSMERNFERSVVTFGDFAK